MMLLKEKIILITGSTTGIGAAAARRCVEAGAKVMIQGRDEIRAKQLCNELKGAAKYVICDLTEPDSYAFIVQTTVDAFGTLHGLVNNAGIYPRSTIDNADAEHFDYVM